MPPPKNIPPKPTTSVSRASYPPASQRPSSRAENPQPGDDEDNPIVVDQANEDSTADISSSSHQRKERAPEAALAAHILDLISKAILKGFPPKPTKKKTQGEEETADAGDTDKENCEEEGDWEVEADEETKSDDDDSKDGSNDPQGAIEDEDDLDVSRALNPDLDVDPGDEDQLRDVAKSAAENAKPSTSSRATRELLLRNKEIAAAMKKMAWLATLLRYSPYKRRMFQRHCARMGCEEPHSGGIWKCGGGALRVTPGTTLTDSTSNLN
ncbi:hypothetical protein A4X06_0g5286 [Tilletia controversa]|uniref:Uncharacterized protein n=1 Tax=Tilletia controversa TaxID=13291 RepID=A0A8X7MRC3_9BASI|nr:hypothetical protein A4X06_0g5286 [Tilletia controversa]